MKIIGLLGHAGVGKNYIAENIIPKYINGSYLVLAFADHFKIDCITKHNFEYNKVFGEKDYETRKALQRIGTEEGRHRYGEDIWIRIVENWIKVFNSRGIENFIISDVRFQNEVNWIKSMGGKVIKIISQKRLKIQLEKESSNLFQKNNIENHESESGIDKIDNYDFILDNDKKINDLSKYFI